MFVFVSIAFLVNVQTYVDRSVKVDVSVKRTITLDDNSFTASPVVSLRTVEQNDRHVTM